MQPLEDLAYINNGIRLNKIKIVADCAAAPWAAIMLCSLEVSLGVVNPIYSICLTNLVCDIAMLVK